MLPSRLFVALLMLCFSAVAEAWTTATLVSFIAKGSVVGSTHHRTNTYLWSSPIPSNDDDASEGGADLVAEFFKLAQSKGIGLDAEDLLEEEEDNEEDDEEDEEEEVNIPQSAVNAFLGYDTGDVGNLAGNVSLTNDQLYSEVKERVLDTAGGFVDFVKAARDDDSGDDEGDEESPKGYQPPATIPDAELTAGEVVLTVLESLRNNNDPTKNKGVEILFGFSSPTSQVKTEAGLTPDEYADFLQETEYKVLLDGAYKATIEKADYSNNGLKAFFTARLTHSISARAVVNVNFILSSCATPASEDSCWMIDSILIRPESMRRRRRR